jgi:prepilin-type N-terminal cleavage/methylation domain-containing protein
MLQKLNHSRRGAFTLVEIMIVLAIIALLASIAVPNFLRSRKRSQATQVLEDLRMIDAAVDQFAIENNKKLGEAATWAEIQKYLKPGSRLYNSNHLDVLGGDFGASFTVDTPPQVPGTSYSSLSDVAPHEFWGPYHTAAAP